MTREHEATIIRAVNSVSAGAAGIMSKKSNTPEGFAEAQSTASPLQTMAQVQLRSALREVRRQLKKMEDRWKKDSEPLHQARVFARRSQVCLELFHPLYIEKKEAAWISARLRELLKVSGKARDLDVLLSNAVHKGAEGSEKHIRSWQKQRKECQPALEAFTKKLQKKSRFKEHSRTLLNHMESAGSGSESQIAPETWASQQIHHQIERLLTQVPASVTARTLHKFRLGTKQTRYAADCIGEMVDCPAADELSELLSDVQKELGNIQDAVVAQKQRQKAIEKSTRKRRSDAEHEAESVHEGTKAEALASLIQKAADWIHQDIVPRLQKIAASLVQTSPLRNQDDGATHPSAVSEQALVKAVTRKRKKQLKKQSATV